MTVIGLIVFCFFIIIIQVHFNVNVRGGNTHKKSLCTQIWPVNAIFWWHLVANDGASAVNKRTFTIIHAAK